MKKNIFLSIFFFTFGFFIHALFFPEFLANGISDVSPIAIPIAEPSSKPGGLRSLTTEVYFDGEGFNKHNITIEAGTYLMVINKSTNKLMWLLSNEPALATPRGYGESEAVRQRMETKGQFVVADKNNQKERIIITVK